MPLLHDSEAVLAGHVLSPHRGALELLRSVLAGHEPRQLKWLDLGCGRGEILAHVPDALSSAIRSRISYFGFDLRRSYVGETSHRAESCGFNGRRVAVAELADLDRSLPSTTFHFVTAINVLHELPPQELARFLCCCAGALRVGGLLYVVDMERLPNPELGAVTWTAEEATRFLAPLVRSMMGRQDDLGVSRWPHETCPSWSLQARWRSRAERAAFAGRRGSVERYMARAIRDLLPQKLDSVATRLAAFRDADPETPIEEDQMVTDLYDFWALARTGAAT